MSHEEDPMEQMKEMDSRVAKLQEKVRKLDKTERVSIDAVNSTGSNEMVDSWPGPMKQ